MRTTQFQTSNISKFVKNTKRLTPAEDAKLFEIIRNNKGTKLAARAREMLYTSHLAEIMQMIKDYGHASLEYGDILNTAALALGEAIDSYNPNSGASLYTHASWKVRGKLSKLFKDCELLHIPSNKQDTRRELNNRVNKGETLNAKENNLYKDLNPKYMSTSMPLDSDSDATIEDLLKASNGNLEDEMYAKEICQILRGGMKALKPRERDIVERAFGLGYRDEESLNDIAREQGVAHQYIGQLKRQALKKLRQGLGNRATYIE